MSAPTITSGTQVTLLAPFCEEGGPGCLAPMTDLDGRTLVVGVDHDGTCCHCYFCGAGLCAACGTAIGVGSNTYPERVAAPVCSHCRDEHHLHPRPELFAQWTDRMVLDYLAKAELTPDSLLGLVAPYAQVVTEAARRNILSVTLPF